MYSLGVVVPTRDSMALLRAHVESMRAWMDVARQIVVVDSDSQDGTVDFLRREWAGLPVRFVSHPPGLYASWNHGIGQLQTEFTYVSTVGDTIRRDGLIGLVDAAQRLEADVVISPPAFVDEHDRTLYSNRWPIHRILEALRPGEAACVDPLMGFVLALNFLPFAILGSSASNLYRTATVQRSGFPTDFGGNGDGAWGLFHALEIRLGIYPECVSTFRRHKKPHKDRDTSHDADGRMLEEGIRIFAEHLEKHPEMRARAEEIGVERIIAAKRVVQEWRGRLKDFRRGWWPWSLNPAAWRARSRREQAQADCEKLVRGLLESAKMAGALRPEADLRGAGRSAGARLADVGPERQIGTVRRA